MPIHPLYGYPVDDEGNAYTEPDTQVRHKTCEQLVPLTPPLPECDTQLWLLTHPESRHLRRIAAVAGHLATTIKLP